jgi:hypothetical protein
MRIVHMLLVAVLCVALLMCAWMSFVQSPLRESFEDGADADADAPMFDPSQDYFNLTTGTTEAGAYYSDASGNTYTEDDLPAMWDVLSKWARTCRCKLWINVLPSPKFVEIADGSKSAKPTKSQVLKLLKKGLQAAAVGSPNAPGPFLCCSSKKPTERDQERGCECSRPPSTQQFLPSFSGEDAGGGGTGASAAPSTGTHSDITQCTSDYCEMDNRIFTTKDTSAIVTQIYGRLKQCSPQCSLWVQVFEEEPLLVNTTNKGKIRTLLDANRNTPGANITTCCASRGTAPSGVYTTTTKATTVYDNARGQDVTTNTVSYNLNCRDRCSANLGTLPESSSSPQQTPPSGVQADMPPNSYSSPDFGSRAVTDAPLPAYANYWASDSALVQPVVDDPNTGSALGIPATSMSSMSSMTSPNAFTNSRPSSSSSSCDAPGGSSYNAYGGDDSQSVVFPNGSRMLPSNINNRGQQPAAGSPVVYHIHSWKGS